jgi:predicted phage baseplate assembly protein
MKRGRLLLVSGTTEAGEDQAETVSLKEVQPLGSKWQLVLDGNLSTEYVRASVVVYGNVALATHGETVQQLLGSGSGSTPFQRFTLAHDPLTYVQSTDPSGGEAALDVRVNDVLWNDVPTLYGAARRDRAYAVRTDEEGKTYVQFGDGERGSRLPTGTNNVRTTYRKGLGAAGNVKSGALSQLLDRPLGVKGVSNPAAAAGGVDPEGEDAARASIPLAVRTIERAVSVLDYEDYALAFTGVAKAKAAVLTLGTGRAIVVTVAFEGGDRLDDLATSLRTHGDPRVQVVVLAGTTQPFRLALKVAVDPAYQADVVLSDVERALRTAYSVDARDFVQPVYRSEIDAVAHSVPGVLAVDVDLLYTGTTSSVADRLFAPQATVAADGTAIAAGLLVLDDAPLDWLQEMPT